MCIRDSLYADYREGKAFMHSHTYSGNPLGCSAALAGADAGSPLGIDLASVLLVKKSALKDRKPMVWAGGGYGGQVAVRFDAKKVIRRDVYKRQA